jgi:hypothetical protein
MSSINLDKTYYGGIDKDVYNEFVVGGDEDDGYPDNIMGGNYKNEMDADYLGGDDFDYDSNTIVGGYDENSIVGGYDLYGGGKWTSLIKTCVIAFIVVALIIIFLKYMSRSGLPIYLPEHSRYENSGRSLGRSYVHQSVFDNTLVPSSYFDSDAHGLQYINWVQNQ